ncbi:MULTISPECIES: hypothetical protein [unclassified Helicobacter]|nr:MULTISPECIES: hypothetical protein [unclassified Helicobacter]
MDSALDSRIYFLESAFFGIYFLESAFLESIFFGESTFRIYKRRL